MISRLGADAFWNRLHLLYAYEAEKRALRYTQRIDRSERNHDAPDLEYRPGQIAYAWGGNTNAYFDFLAMHRYKLNKEERALEQYYRPFAAKKLIGKYCVILSRLNHDPHENQYLVCLLSTFGGTEHAKEVRTPVNRFFAVPMGPWIEGSAGNIEPIHTNPPWNKPSFVLGAPVIRRVITSARLPYLYSLAPGELDRLLAILRIKVERFHKRSDELRAEFLYTLRHIKSRDARDLERVEEFAEDVDPTRAYLPRETRRQKEAKQSEAARARADVDASRWDNGPGSKKRTYFTPLHLLSTGGHDITWPLQYVEHDIVHSSPVLSHRKVYNTVLKNLPPSPQYGS